MGLAYRSEMVSGRQAGDRPKGCNGETSSDGREGSSNGEVTSNGEATAGRQHGEATAGASDREQRCIVQS